MATETKAAPGPVPEFDNDREVTLIRPSLTLKGDVTTEDNIVLEGTLEGSISSEAFVYVSASGKILGDIKAGNVIIDGEVEGNIEAVDRIELRPASRVVGDIRGKRAKISEGSTLAGNLTVLGAGEPPPSRQKGDG